jgi:hypothetical protein
MAANDLELSTLGQRSIEQRIQGSFAADRKGDVAVGNTTTHSNNGNTTNIHYYGRSKITRDSGVDGTPSNTRHCHGGTGLLRRPRIYVVIFLGIVVLVVVTCLAKLLPKKLAHRGG